MLHVKISKQFHNIQRQGLSHLFDMTTWHAAKYGDPYWNLCSAYTHPSAHTQQWSHTPWTHTRSSGQPFMLRAQGAVGGSVGVSLLVILCIFVYVTNKALLSLIIHFFFSVLLKGPSSWYRRWRGHCTFTPPTYNPCRTETWTLNLSIASPNL